MSQQVFDTPGSYTFTVGATTGVNVSNCIGGGGGGCGEGSGTGTGGSGGGGGGCAASLGLIVSTGDVVVITVGSGGAQGLAIGSAGTLSKVTINGTQKALGNPGGGGHLGVPGSGGSATGLTSSHTGGTGVAGAPTFGGGGAGGAADSGNGGTGLGFNGGTGGSSTIGFPGGHGGNGANGAAAAANGNFPGAGGGGGKPSNVTAGTGANGQVVVTWLSPSSSANIPKASIAQSDPLPSFPGNVHNSVARVAGSSPIPVAISKLLVTSESLAQFPGSVHSSVTRGIASGLQPAFRVPQLLAASEPPAPYPGFANTGTLFKQGAINPSQVVPSPPALLIRNEPLPPYPGQVLSSFTDVFSPPLPGPPVIPPMIIATVEPPAPYPGSVITRFTATPASSNPSQDIPTTPTTIATGRDLPPESGSAFSFRAAQNDYQPVNKSIIAGIDPLPSNPGVVLNTYTRKVTGNPPAVLAHPQ